MITGKQILESESLWERLDGAYFHVVDDSGCVIYQGHVMKVLGNSRFKFQLYEWFLGEASDEGWGSKLEIENWIFYGDSYQMRVEYEKRKRANKERENKKSHGDLEIV